MSAKKVMLAVASILGVLSPAVAFANPATNAALGLGAFAVFNQILSGTGVFGGFYGAPPPVMAAPPPVVVAPPPVVAVPQPVYIVQPPPVVVAPPPPVIYYPPAQVYSPPARAYYAPRRPVPVHGWYTPGHAPHGRY